ncbi:hypothetical protein GUJ93_ZPchr0003g18118 [Zizania palustris]|uniref:Uncharacterized protein n=1 Tax=Zizania palustris TaxID=103762 RepID=A0A8J5STU1_ZIZPA|nr:hypothetical protein GUJ93_ZPchr0003g18118 [Zizania palustris]
MAAPPRVAPRWTVQPRHHAPRSVAPCVGCLDRTAPRNLSLARAPWHRAPLRAGLRHAHSALVVLRTVLDPDSASLLIHRFYFTGQRVYPRVYGARG